MPPEIAENTIYVKWGEGADVLGCPTLLSSPVVCASTCEKSFDVVVHVRDG